MVLTLSQALNNILSYLYFHPRIDGSQWTNADFLKSHCEEMMLAKWKEYVARDDRHELESNKILTM